MIPHRLDSACVISIQSTTTTTNGNFKKSPNNSGESTSSTQTGTIHVTGDECLYYYLLLYI